eukprot:TRINITY_DN679_c0_g1_i2.p1 TRINITY_DN679_c0_g1~~TRINITY_DN679_c0_g1_i2.p1  ORF type:complete len:132 (-),score=24.64 TRINITY_DN679_c0_g1_i2:90-485(-)
MGKQIIRFPDTGTVFDYVSDIKRSGSTLVCPEFQFVPDAPRQQIAIHTKRLFFVLDLFLKLGKPIVLVAPAGSGMAVLIKEKLSQLDRDAMISSTNFNYFSVAEHNGAVAEEEDSPSVWTVRYQEARVLYR